MHNHNPQTHSTSTRRQAYMICKQSAKRHLFLLVNKYGRNVILSVWRILEQALPKSQIQPTAVSRHSKQKPDQACRLSLSMPSVQWVAYNAAAIPQYKPALSDRSQKWINRKNIRKYNDILHSSISCSPSTNKCLLVLSLKLKKYFQPSKSSFINLLVLEILQKVLQALNKKKKENLLVLKTSNWLLLKSSCR